jgi:hypothetical protein
VTDEQWEQIKPFAEAAARARLAYRNMGAWNTPTDPRKAMEQAIEYERLRVNVLHAEQELRKAERHFLDTAHAAPLTPPAAP